MATITNKLRLIEAANSAGNSIIICKTSKQAVITSADGTEFDVTDFLHKSQISYGYNKGFEFELIYKAGDPESARLKKSIRSGFTPVVKELTATTPKVASTRRMATIGMRHQATKTILQLLEGINKADTVFTDEFEKVQFIHQSYTIKPSYYKISELKWKAAVRAVIRGENIMITGPKGEGKTMLAYVLKEVLDRPFFKLDLGNSRDANTTILGKTHAADGGTYFLESDFIRAIQIPNSIILLDEFSRASRDAANLLMPLLDENIREISINSSEHENHTVKLAQGVCFIATANIGMEYTGTSIMDTAVIDRFTKIEVDNISKEDLIDLMQEMFPAITKPLIEKVVTLIIDIRLQVMSGNSILSQAVSTRKLIELGKYLTDGFTYEEACALVIEGLYSYDGGQASERVLVKQMIQKPR